MIRSIVAGWVLAAPAPFLYHSTEVKPGVYMAEMKAHDGYWRSGPARMVFRADGTMRWTMIDQWQNEGQWRFKDGRLTLKEAHWEYLFRPDGSGGWEGWSVRDYPFTDGTICRVRVFLYLKARR